MLRIDNYAVEIILAVAFALAGLRFVWWLFRTPSHRDLCCHAWTLAADKEFPSRLEEAKKHWRNLTGMDFGQFGSMCSKVYFAVLKCDKCGATKEFRSES